MSLKYIKYYNNIVKYVKSEYFESGESLHVKHNELTYIDPKNRKVFKRVFKSNIEFNPDPRDFSDVSKIIEMNKNYNSSYDFVLEYVNGHDVGMLLSARSESSHEILEKFDDFLAKWVNYNPEKEIIESLSIDINAGNFVYNQLSGKITKVDYVSDWGKKEKPIWFYLKPYIKLIKNDCLTLDQVKKTIDKRFANHKTRKLNFDTLWNEFNELDDDVSFSKDSHGVEINKDEYVF